MTPEQIERVFGCSRLKMATGEHVEVFREAVRPGERRRYTKRFLETGDADFRQWTEREWRMLARLIGHGIRCVPGVVRFDGGDEGGMRQVQTYDAGVTVDQWATLLPVARDGVVLRHVFEDCAHWWALAHHCLAALEEIHALQLVHLDIKADNICIPYAPTNFDPDASGVRLRATFTQLALIDFAFSLVSRESLATALPIGWQKDYDYQSPRLLIALEAGRAGNLAPTQELDWRCDLYSLAAMLRRYLPDEAEAAVDGGANGKGWTAKRYDSARALIYRLRDCHDGDFSLWRPHRDLMEITAAHLTEADLTLSLAEGWTLARDVELPAAPSLVTPLTRIAAPLQTTDAAPASLVTAATIVVPAVFRTPRARIAPLDPPPGLVAETARPRRNVARGAVLATSAVVALACPPFIGDPSHPFADQARQAFAELRSRLIAEPAPAVPPIASAASRSAANAPANNTRADDARAEDTPPASEPRAPEPADAASAEPGMPAADSSTASDASPPTEAAAEPASPARVDAPSPTFRKSAKIRAKPGEQTKRASSAPKGSQVARGGPPASDASRSHTAAEPQKPRRDIASSSVAPARSVRLASATPTARPVSTTPQLAAAASPAAAQSEIRIDLPLPATPIEERAQAPAAPSTQPSASSGAPSSPDVATPAKSQSAAVKPPIVSPPKTTPRKRDAFQEAVHSVLQAFGVREQRAVPVEERNTQASPKVAEGPRAPTQPAQAAVNAPVPQMSAPVPQMSAPVVATPALSPPEAPITAPAFNPAPRPSPPRMFAVAAGTDASDDALGEQGRRMLFDSLPRVAAQARADATTVLYMAAVADHPAQSAGVVNAALGPWSTEQLYFPGPRDSVRARRLYEEAKGMFAAGRTSDALDVGVRAFASDPRDPTIAGFLAVVHLSVRPPQPETARQLALQALAFSGSRRSTRADDWETLAIASALTGRESDATRALLVELAVTPDLHRSCDTVQRAYATFGERLRVPVQAMLARIRAHRRDYESPACAWLNYQAYQTARRW